MATPVGWVVRNWRLKLLALVLAVGLLGAVAFSENPPTFDTVAVRVEYRNPPPYLVLVNPPLTVNVDVAGLRDDVARYKQGAAGVSIDLSRAQPGANQMFVATPKTDVPGVTFRQPTIPIRLSVEPLVVRSMEIEVRTPNKSPGIAVVPNKTYATCGNANDHCQVAVTGPGSIVSNLKAFVKYDVTITAAASGSSPNQPIQFELDGKTLDLGRSPRTIPPSKWTPEVVTVLVTTQGGSQTKVVPVSIRVQGTQACGYQISGIEVQPNQVTVTGPVDAVSRITNVTMDPVNIANLTSGQRVFRSVVTGAGSVTSDPAQVVVTVGVNQAFSCTAPTPAAGVQPAPSTPAPTPSVTPTPTP